MSPVELAGWWMLGLVIVTVLSCAAAAIIVHVAAKHWDWSERERRMLRRGRPFRRVCVECGAEFTAVRSNSTLPVCCSDACRRRRHAGQQKRSRLRRLVGVDAGVDGGGERVG